MDEPQDAMPITSTPHHHHHHRRRPPATTSSSRIVKVPRLSGGKDRHSKVLTAQGLRDRRVRLSVPTAIQFYDLQDRLGLDRPSKAVDWLITAAAAAISRLPAQSPSSETSKATDGVVGDDLRSINPPYELLAGGGVGFSEHLELQQIPLLQGHLIPVGGGCGVAQGLDRETLQSNSSSHLPQCGGGHHPPLMPTFTSAMEGSDSRMPFVYGHAVPAVAGVSLQYPGGWYDGYWHYSEIKGSGKD